MKEIPNLNIHGCKKEGEFSALAEKESTSTTPPVTALSQTVFYSACKPKRLKY
jgi:hypothetical protein